MLPKFADQISQPAGIVVENRQASRDVVKDLVSNNHHEPPDERKYIIFSHSANPNHAIKLITIMSCEYEPRGDGSAWAHDILSISSPVALMMRSPIELHASNHATPHVIAATTVVMPTKNTPHRALRRANNNEINHPVMMINRL